MKLGDKLRLQSGDYANLKSQMLGNQESTPSSKEFSKIPRGREVSKGLQNSEKAGSWNFVAFAAVRRYHPYRPRSSSGIEEMHLRQPQ